jgi:hypothetical protein
MRVMLVGALAVNFTACDNGTTGEDPFTPAPSIEMPLTAKRWENPVAGKAHQWESGFIRTAGYTPQKIKRGDVLKFKISGTADKAIEYAQISLFQFTNNVVDYDNPIYLGGSQDRLSLGASFSNKPISFMVNIVDVNPNWDVYFQVVNMLWQENPNGENVYGDGQKFPDDVENGDLMATISGFTASIEKITVEDLPYEERWYAWAEPTSTATLDRFSFENNGNNDPIVKVVVGGTPRPDGENGIWEIWHVLVQYYYTAEAGKNYTYQFSARTETGSGSRTVQVQYYEDNDIGEWKNDRVTLTDSWQTFTIKGETLPKGGLMTLNFQCANAIGTYYIKDMKITKSNDVPKTITIAGIPSDKIGYNTALTVLDDNMNGDVNMDWDGLYQVADKWYGRVNVSSVSFSMKEVENGMNDNTVIGAWTGSGPYYLRLWLINSDDSDGHHYYYTNGTGELQKIGITSATTSIPFSKFTRDEDVSWGNQGILVGTITGTITLTDVPSPAPRVYVNVYGSGNSGGEWRSYNANSSNIIPGSGNYTNIPWSIPVYENEDNHFVPSDGDFSLSVEFANGTYVNFPIQAAPYIGSANALAGSLGTVSLKTITLSGTINVTYNGAPAPRVEIGANAGSVWGSAYLDTPAANAQWSIVMPALSSSAEVFFNVWGYSADYGENLFNRSVTLDNPVYVYNTNVSGITLNIGNYTSTPVGNILVTPLSADAWKDGKLNDYWGEWYLIDVTSGTYYLWLNNVNEGNNTKTSNSQIEAYYSRDLQTGAENRAFGGSISNAWDNPVSFTADSSRKVYIHVSGSEGTFAIAYSTSNNRP